MDLLFVNEYIFPFLFIIVKSQSANYLVFSEIEIVSVNFLNGGVELILSPSYFSSDSRSQLKDENRSYEDFLFLDFLFCFCFFFCCWRMVEWLKRMSLLTGSRCWIKMELPWFFQHFSFSWMVF